MAIVSTHSQNVENVKETFTATKSTHDAELCIGIASDEKGCCHCNKRENLFHRSRFDLGVNFGAGVHFNAFRVEVGYNLGLLDIDNSKEYTTNSNHVYVGVGFAF